MTRALAVRTRPAVCPTCGDPYRLTVTVQAPLLLGCGYGEQTRTTAVVCVCESTIVAVESESPRR